MPITQTPPIKNVTPQTQTAHPATSVQNATPAVAQLPQTPPIKNVTPQTQATHPATSVQNAAPEKGVKA